MWFPPPRKLISRKIFTYIFRFPQRKTHIQIPSDRRRRRNRNLNGCFDGYLFHFGHSPLPEKRTQASFTLQQIDRFQCVLVLSPPLWSGLCSASRPWNVLVFDPSVVPENGKNFNCYLQWRACLIWRWKYYHTRFNSNPTVKTKWMQKQRFQSVGKVTFTSSFIILQRILKILEVNV